jgi:N-acetylmuramoyl-L-alanine amidase
VTAPFSIPAAWAWRPSPNHSPRRAPVTAIVLHADAASRIDSSLDWVRRPESEVSYHIMVGRTGEVFSVVSPDRTAWHAGVSSMDGARFVNRFSVGVCLSNRNDGDEPFPPAQVASAVSVCAVLCEHYRIDVARITTHALIAPTRKTDPKGLDLVLFRDAVTARVVPPKRAA